MQTVFSLFRHTCVSRSRQSTPFCPNWTIEVFRELNLMSFQFLSVFACAFFITTSRLKSKCHYHESKTFQFANISENGADSQMP